MATTSSATWIKLADMHETQQIIKINAYEFILIPSELSIICKYNSLTNSFNEYIKDSNVQINYNSIVKAAFNETKQTLYVHYRSRIYSVDVTTNIWNTSQLQNTNLTTSGCYVLSVNNHLHFIKDHNGHWIRSIQNNALNIVSDSTEEYTHGRQSGAAIYISSKQCILLIGGYSTSGFNFLSNVWIYSLQTQKWSKINNISFKRYQFGYILTSNQRYIILFGGWKNDVGDGDEEVNDICVLDMKYDNNWKLNQCKIKCPDIGMCYAVRTGGMDSNNILINGFVKKCFRLKEFTQLELPPACIVSIIGKYFSAEMIHYISRRVANKHYGIYLKDILSSLYEC